MLILWHVNISLCNNAIVTTIDFNMYSQRVFKKQKHNVKRIPRIAATIDSNGQLVTTKVGSRDVHGNSSSSSSSSLKIRTK